MGQPKSKHGREAPESVSVGENVLRLLSVTDDVNCMVTIELYETQQATPLWITVYMGDYDLTSHLISRGASVNIACGNLKLTPLHIACYSHNVKMSQLLLESGADPNTMDEWNMTPALYAVLCNEPFTVQQLLSLLLKHGSNMNYGATKSLADQYAFNQNIGELQCKYNGDLLTFVTQPQGPGSGVPLHYAAQNPYIPNEILCMICDAGAEIDSQNLHGQTPLMCAITDIYYEYHQYIREHVQLLIARGADVNCTDIRGWTPLHYACQRGGTTTMKTLIEHGADCNLLGSLGESPLWVLLCHGWKSASKFLIQNGCEMNQPIKSTSIVKINNDVDLPRFGDITPLEFLLCNKQYDLAKLLILAGCRMPDNIDFCNQQGKDEKCIRKLQELKCITSYRYDPLRVRTLKELAAEQTRAAYSQAIGFKLDKVGAPQTIKDFILLEK